MVSILPLRFIVEQITGDDFNIEVLVAPGASPETYEPTPAQMISIEKSPIVFVTGLIDFEKQLADKISLQSADNKIINLSAGVDLIEGHCTHGDTPAHGHTHGTDPHIWASPRNLKTMALTVYRNIALLYPDSVRYSDNYTALTARLDSLDTAVGERLAASGKKQFIIYHPALTYYARDYGLEQISLEEEGKEPSVERMKAIIAGARQSGGITKIFYQKQFSPATVETLARELGAVCVEIDPLAEDVIANTLEITEKITSDGTH